MQCTGLLRRISLGEDFVATAVEYEVRTGLYNGKLFHALVSCTETRHTLNPYRISVWEPRKDIKPRNAHTELHPLLRETMRSGKVGVKEISDYLGGCCPAFTTWPGR